MLGASYGWANAWGEMTLVFFTTVAPSAAVAYMLMAAVLAFAKVDEGVYRHLRKLLWVPLTLCMVGLVASSTHLGNPANALYVITRIGESPLSNEVCGAVVFLACSAVFWLAGFAVERKKVLDAVLVAAVEVTGAVCVALISLAYNVDTIVTWSLPLFPATIALSGGIGGTLVAHECLRAAVPRYGAAGASGGARSGMRVLARALLAAFVVCGVAWIGMHAIVGRQLAGLGNALFSAAELVPMYGLCLAIAAALLVVAGLVEVWAARLHPRQARIAGIGGIALALCAIFIMRVMFYMMHLTAGVAL